MISARPLALALFLALPLTAAAQSPSLTLPSFEHLRDRAIDSVDITLGTWPLNLAGFLMDDDRPHDAELKEVLKGLKSIRVRTYTFAHDFEYPEEDVEAVRRQLKDAGWTSLLQVRSRPERSAVDVCVALEDGRATGLAIVATEPREFTIVNIIGSIDASTLDKLGGHMGVPKLDALRNTAQAQ